MTERTEEDLIAARLTNLQNAQAKAKKAEHLHSALQDQYMAARHDQNWSSIDIAAMKEAADIADREWKRALEETLQSRKAYEEPLVKARAAELVANAREALDHEATK